MSEPARVVESPKADPPAPSASPASSEDKPLTHEQLEKCVGGLGPHMIPLVR